VSREAIAVAGLSAFAIATSGCTGDSDAEAETGPATTTGQVGTQPPARSAVNIAKIRAAFKETFGTPPHERPWYHLITGMKLSSVNSRWLEITAELKESDPLLGVICGAAMNVEAGDGIEAVRVMGSDGVELGGCA